MIWASGRPCKDFVRETILEQVASSGLLHKPPQNYFGLPAAELIFERRLLTLGVNFENLWLYEKKASIFNDIKKNVAAMKAFSSPSRVEVINGDILTALEGYIPSSSMIYLDLCSTLNPQVLKVVSNVFNQLDNHMFFGLTFSNGREKNCSLDEYHGPPVPTSTYKAMDRVQTVLNAAVNGDYDSRFVGNVYQYKDGASMITMFGAKIRGKRKHQYEYFRL